MLHERMLKCIYVLVHLMSELIEVRHLLLLGFHQLMSMMRNQGQLLLDLEYSTNYWVLAVHWYFFLHLWDTLHFLRHSLSEAGLNRAKLQSVESLDALFGEASELFGSCDLNACLILDKDSVFRETSEV
jgi:hypothetical protein